MPRSKCPVELNPNTFARIPEGQRRCMKGDNHEGTEHYFGFAGHLIGWVPDENDPDSTVLWIVNSQEKPELLRG